MVISEHDLIAANESEQAALQKIEGVLDSSELRDEDLESGQSDHLPKLVSPYGDEIELPPSVFQVLRQIVYHLTLGKAVNIVPVNKELSILEAAHFLNISTSYLISLLESGKLPFVQRGTDQLILFTDLLEYKKRRHEERMQGLAEILHMCQDEGIYD
jgi:excisionase family DNA binding protein